MIKEILYTGLGGAMLLKERVDEEIEKLQEKGKLSKEDAQVFMDKLKVRGEEEETKLKSHIKEALKEVIDEMGLATKADIEALKEK
jgi:polyhydroxyalkanoate synthesis regulator phasin